MTGVAMYRARNLLSNPKDNPTLPDMGFDLLPYANICKESMLPSLVLLVFMCKYLNGDEFSNEVIIGFNSINFFLVATLFRHMIFDKQNGLVNFCRFCILDGIGKWQTKFEGKYLTIIFCRSDVITCHNCRPHFGMFHVWYFVGFQANQWLFY